MNVTTSTSINKLTEELNKLNTEKSTGNLVINTNQKVFGKIHLFSGRVLYFTSVVHRSRRWERALKQHCPQWDFAIAQLSDNELPWEFKLLYEGISSKQLTMGQVKAVTSNVTLECLFELSEQTNFSFQWNGGEKGKSDLSLYLTLSAVEMHSVMKKAMQLQQQWQSANLANLNPRLAPILKQDVEHKSLAALERYLNGKYTLWDIAFELDKSVTDVTRYLLPLIGKGLIQFRELPDINFNQSVAPVKDNLPKQAAKAVKKNALIACIDDSPVVGHNLKKILRPAGYEILIITEPMRGFTDLIERKPDLIFLDLNMPNANGYSVCQFLKTSPVFANTPIIILTAQDTLIDRSRAKLVGATDFIGKPAEAEELLKMVEKYLG
ncbi:MAG: response regulator [Gomphosphaeria aponina SAG 52.96 = DSM 107014]|uniref:Protein PatA n=1 Tax=Gomphosphaeria aponina SAG 52.96 = DSM 107014 TaxID=1521640 RepID=A0A941GX29_9CHRO|nr:response regulator [Gomphosphaeria aponina SAG 52.96 = DSM 107014]